MSNQDALKLTIVKAKYSLLNIQVEGKLLAALIEHVKVAFPNYTELKGEIEFIEYILQIIENTLLQNINIDKGALAVPCIVIFLPILCRWDNQSTKTNSVSREQQDHSENACIEGSIQERKELRLKKSYWCINNYVHNVTENKLNIQSNSLAQIVINQLLIKIGVAKGVIILILLFL